MMNFSVKEFSNDSEGLGVDPLSSVIWWRTVFIPVIICIICISGLLGNGIVVCVLVRYSDMKTVPNVYIMNLASADLLFMLGIPFLAYQYTGKTWIFGKAMCKLVMGIDGINMFAGIFTLTAMCIDRYLAIVNAIESMTYRTVNSARITCIFIWILSVLATLPLWLYADARPDPTPDSDKIKCDIYYSHQLHITFIIYAFVINFGLPLLIISLCYFRILLYLRKGSRSSHRTNRRSSLGRAGLIVMLAVALFTVCWLPFWVVQFTMAFNPPSSWRTLEFIIAYYCSMCLSYANSCLNPIIYTCAGENFRQKLAKMCSCRKREPEYTLSMGSYYRRSSACYEDVCEMPTMTTTMSSNQMVLIGCHNDVDEMDNSM
ncbi:somatostatin receptor type 5-like [Ptychodera flava]|uniref:somatostatin receptor type 5-like n=1 Tax=Ptychodera flava TaxID=63121 RepID=UPI00396A7502